MADDTIVLAIPRNLRFLESVERFVGVVAAFINAPDTERLFFDLKVALNEAFVNIVKHTSVDSDGLIELAFKVEAKRLTTQIKDFGKGIAIQEFYPPYPKNLIGVCEVLSRNLAGEITATVKDPYTLSLDLKKSKIENKSRENLLEMTAGYGMGLTLIAKMTDQMKFIYDEKDGNKLEFVIHY